MLAEMTNLMKQFLVGEYIAWTPKKRIKEHVRYEVGLPSSDEETKVDEDVVPPN